MARRESDERGFGEIVLALLVGGLVFRYLRRRCGLDVSDPAASEEERLYDLMAEVNAREMSEGRAPFCLLRAPRRDTLRVIPSRFS